jgi:hypothetical protein
LHIKKGGKYKPAMENDSVKEKKSVRDLEEMGGKMNDDQQKGDLDVKVNRWKKPKLVCNSSRTGEGGEGDKMRLE